MPIHPDLERLKSELVAGFMDDLTLGGPAQIVAADIDHIRSREEFTGLQFNPSKCEMISCGVATQIAQFNSRHEIRWWWLQSARHWLTA